MSHTLENTTDAILDERLGERSAQNELGGPPAPPDATNLSSEPVGGIKRGGEHHRDDIGQQEASFIEVFPAGSAMISTAKLFRMAVILDFCEE